jgi:hypothetical protein
VYVPAYVCVYHHLCVCRWWNREDHYVSAAAAALETVVWVEYIRCLHLAWNWQFYWLYFSHQRSWQCWDCSRWVLLSMVLSSLFPCCSPTWVERMRERKIEKWRWEMSKEMPWSQRQTTIHPIIYNNSRTLIGSCGGLWESDWEHFISHCQISSVNFVWAD